MSKITEWLERFFACDPYTIPEKANKSINWLDQIAEDEKAARAKTDEAFKITSFLENTPLTYKGCIVPGCVLLPDNAVIGDAYNHGLVLIVWNGTSWITSSFCHWDDLCRLFKNPIELGEVGEAYRQHLYSINNAFDYGEIVTIHGYKISRGLIEGDYEASVNFVLQCAFNEVEEYILLNNRLFANNIQQATNHKVLEMAIAVSDSSIDDYHVDTIRKELVYRTRVLKEINEVKNLLYPLTFVKPATDYQPVIDLGFVEIRKDGR